MAKDVLVPVGKAYFGFTDAELEVLDRYVRNNTIERFGPVRSIRAEADHGFVVEVAFEGINLSQPSQIRRRDALFRAYRGCAPTSCHAMQTGSKPCRR